MDNYDSISLEDYSPDIESIADQMYLGPQGRILELLNEFNVSYTNYSGTLHAGRNRGRHLLSPIEITKKFRWKPGTYAKIKTMYEHYVMRWQIRPSGVSSLFHRRREHYHRELSRKLLDIENLMRNRRNDGAIWTEDSTKVIEDFNQFKIDLLAKLESLNQYCSKFPEAPLFIVTIIEPSEPVDICFKIRKTSIKLEIFWNKLDINVSNSDRELLQVIPGHKTSIVLRINLLKWFNNYHGVNQDWTKMPMFPSGNNNAVTIHGKLEAGIDGLAHPYIGSRSNYHGINGYSSVCTGDFQDGIVQALSKGTLNPMYDLIMMWMTEYIVGYTGPLNNVNYMHIGVPKDWNKDYADAAGIRTSWCSDIVQGMNTSNLTLQSHSYCEEIECQMMTQCTGYERVTERKQSIAEIVPEIFHISEAKDPRNTTDTLDIYLLLSQLVQSNDDFAVRFYELSRQDWHYIIRNKREDIITKYIEITDSQWFDLDKMRAKEVISDEDMAEEMLTWAISRDSNLAFPRSTRPLPHAPHNTRDTTIEVVDLVATPIQSDMEHEGEIVNNDELPH